MANDRDAREKQRRINEKRATARAKTKRLGKSKRKKDDTRTPGVKYKGKPWW